MKAFPVLLAVLLFSMLPASADPLKVVCLGDSITGPRPNVRYLDKYIKWPDLLEVALEAQLGAGQAQVVNRGHAGDNAAGALARLEEQVIALKPDLVVILIGGNNFAAKESESAKSNQLHNDLSAIVAKLQTAGGRILLLQYPEPKADNMEKVWTHLDDGNPVIAAVAQERKVPTLALAPAFAAAAQSHPQAELTSIVDGVHLNPYGEVVLAKAVFFKLKELGWLSRP